MLQINKKLVALSVVLTLMLTLFFITMTAYAAPGPSRIYSKNASEMSRLIADETKDLLNTNKFSSVILVNCTKYSEAVSVSYLSAQKKAPVLLLDMSSAETVFEYVNNNLEEKGVVYFIIAVIMLELIKTY